MTIKNPSQIAEVGEKVYRERYKATYEIEHSGKFVAIDVINDGHAYLGDSPEAVLEEARRNAPTGVFHLIKVGSPGAFRVSYSSHADLDWAV